MKFKATIQLNGKTATGIEVPAASIDALNAGKRPAVAVKVNAYEYRTAVGVMGGRTLLPFSAEHREKSGLKAGDAVTVELSLDTAPREVIVPEDLKLALGKTAAAGEAFDVLSNSRQRAILTDLDGAKTAA